LPTNAYEVTDIVNSFPSKTSSGCDGITMNIIKKSLKFISVSLVIICNLSFSCGQMPDVLKIAKVCPVYKDGSVSDVNNYRPISVLPSFSKIIERLVHKRLYLYVIKFNILTSAQFGFQQKFSTYMAQIDLYDNISKAIDDNKYPIGIFIDLKKAFDTVDYNILVLKLIH